MNTNISHNYKAQKLIKDMSSPWKFYLAMLFKLPSIPFWGVKMKHLSSEKCSLVIPYKWRNQNPFKSIYFAALAGAAELSTGLLGLVATTGKEKWSMLVVGFNAEFKKKATGNITFTCEQGQKLFQLLDEIRKTGTPQTIEMVSIGKNALGEEVARFYITWSFKKKE